jgi:hypothetical protein
LAFDSGCGIAVFNNVLDRVSDLEESTSLDGLKYTATAAGGGGGGATYTILPNHLSDAYHALQDKDTANKVVRYMHGRAARLDDAPFAKRICGLCGIKDIHRT